MLPGRTITAGPGQDLRTTIPANQLGASFLAKGKYVEFTVVSASLGVRDWTLTGAANPADITGGKRTPVFASKLPDLRGSTLTGGLDIRLRDGDAEPDPRPRGGAEPPVPGPDGEPADSAPALSRFAARGLACV